MDPALQVWLFGEFKVLIHGQPIPAMDTPRLQLLLLI